VRSGVHAESEAGSAPLDLVLFLVVAAIIAAGAWYTVQSGGLLWLVVWLAVGITVVAVMRPVFRRRRRVDAGGQRKVRHDESWTSGREEE
jgi:membrane protein implicated in regulation of membrane protease activity